MRQANRETKENQRHKKGKMLLFNKAVKGCVSDKGRKVITEVVKNSYKGGFITEVYFSFFFDNFIAFHEIFRGKVYFINYIIPVLT